MHSILTTLLLTFTVFGKTEEQADVLLSYPIKVTPKLYGIPHATINPQKNLWIVADWENTPLISKLDEQGKDKILTLPFIDTTYIPKRGFPVIGPSYNMVSDSKGNLYFSSFIGWYELEDYHKSTLHLIRVSSEGQVKDYYPWPTMYASDLHMEVLPGDTLLLMGRDASAPKSSGGYGMPLRISKALITSNDLTPIYEKSYPWHSFPATIRNGNSTYYMHYFDWERGYGYLAYILADSSILGPKPTPDKLTIMRFDLKSSETTITRDSLGTFNWRNFIWRTYKNAWIGSMTFARYKEGGYLLCIPDPADRSVTHILRLDNLGLPIIPSELEGNGMKSTLAFDRITASVKPYVDFQIWDKPVQMTIHDSAQVLFWGCDNEGNLYSFRKVRIY